MQTADQTPWYLETEPFMARLWRSRLRGATCVIELIALALAWTVPTLDIPLDRLWPLVLLSALANGAIAARLWADKPLPRAAEGLALLLDVALLTGLLDLTGGPFNPFIVIYFVQVALAAFTIGPGWAAAAALIAVLGFGW